MPYSEVSIADDFASRGRPQDRLGILLVILLVLGVATTTASLFLFREMDDAAQRLNDISLSQSANYNQLTTFEDLQHHLGYTNFIHNFKNGVLRRDRDLLLTARLQIDRALKALERLEGGNDETDNLRATLQDYREMTFLAIRLIDAGQSTTAIDIAVKIDDGPAQERLQEILSGIHDARDEIEASLQGQSEQTARILQVFKIAVAGMIILTVAILLIYFQVRQNTRMLTRTASSLQSANSFIAERIRQLVGLVDASEPVVVPVFRMPDRSRSVYQSLGDLEGSLTELINRMGSQEDRLIAHTKALEVANEELSRFSYVASHDLQEPLRKIQTNIDLIALRHRDEIGEDLGKRLDRLNASAFKMRGLIEDLLAYSRAGSQPLNMDMLDPRDIVRAAVAETEHLFTDKSGKVEVVIPEGAPVPGDRTQICQVFINILSNAAKYARQDRPPVMKITGSYTPHRFTLSFADNGIGIDPIYAEQIFEPFRKLHGKAEYEGSGIGLSIVKRAILRHGGNVRVISNEDEGATFIVNLILNPSDEVRENNNDA